MMTEELKPWSKEEENLISNLWKEQAPLEYIAKKVSRSVPAVKERIKILKLGRRRTKYGEIRNRTR